MGRKNRKIDSWGIIWKYAGIIGIDPGKLTLRQLADMADERERSNWWHTASLLATIHNALSTSKPKSPADFHPMEKKKEDDIIWCGKDLSLLKTIFCKKRKK